MRKPCLFLLPLFVCLCAAPAQTQAPQLNGPIYVNLQSLQESNKALIERQQKTLDLLDQLQQNAEQLKIFGKRS